MRQIQGRSRWRFRGIWPEPIQAAGERRGRAPSLRETLAEEEKTDKLLTDLAEATINAAAEQPAA